MICADAGESFKKQFTYMNTLNVLDFMVWASDS